MTRNAFATLSLLIVLLASGTAWGSTGGVVLANFTFYNEQIGYTTSPGGTDWYKDTQFHTQQPINDVMVSMINPADGSVMGTAWTDAHGWLQMMWHSPTNALTGFFRVYLLSPTLFPRVIPAQIREGRGFVSRIAGVASGTGSVAESEQPGGDASLRRAVRLARGSARAAGFS